MKKTDDLSKIEVEFLKESNAIEREYSEEALEDAKKAWYFAKSYAQGSRKINKDLILTTHKILMSRLDPRIAGKIREHPVAIGGEVRRQSKEDIEIELNLWIASYAKRGDEEGIKESHVLFEKIHPFEDGNGRTGRILMNLQHLLAGNPLMIIHEGEEQRKYYTWFR